MSLRDLSLKRSYSSDQDNILTTFYVPVLQESLTYDRLAGFFSSSTLAAAARGILPFIRNGGVMRLVTSVHIPPYDYDLLKSVTGPDLTKLYELLNLELNDFQMDLASKNHVRAMGWMLAHGQLDIKIAIPFDLTPGEKLFHQKVGIFGDSQGNFITFSGSINESAAAWLGNIEEFKVFCSWKEVEIDYVNLDVQNFRRFWINQSKHALVVDLPEAMKQELIRIAPDSLDELNLDKYYSDGIKPKSKQLFVHQLDAIDSWLQSGLKGIFEMATGSGKTLTAIAAAGKVQEFGDPLLIVIACPQSHLSRQWEKEIAEFGLVSEKVIYADSSNNQWKNHMADLLSDLSLGYKKNGLILTTHRTASSQFFITAVDSLNQNVKVLFIGDEIHGLGASKSRLALLPKYNYRIGLSATVERQFDEVGTNYLLDYFGGIISQFTLKDGINTINPLTGISYLTPFSYHPSFVSLTDIELENYLEQSNRIIRMLGRASSDKDIQERLESVLFKRADIVKNAELKYSRLEDILDEIADNLKGTIIYCSPQQIERVLAILGRRKIRTHPFTMNEGTSPDNRYNGYSEREYILEHFGKGNYEVLVAMKCLDEGVNVPQANKMILMSSSGNKREYIQRIGRVIRRYPGKDEAKIFDIVAASSLEVLPPELHRIERNILEKELKRYLEIAQYASNPAEAMKKISGLRRRMGV